MNETRFIPTEDGGRAEMLIPVDGVPTWRAAQWVSEVAYQMCSRHGIHDERAPVLRPVLTGDECLRTTADGRMDIVRVPHVCHTSRTCTCSMLALEPDEECPVHGAGEWPPRCATCGKWMPWSERMTP